MLSRKIPLIYVEMDSLLIYNWSITLIIHISIVLKMEIYTIQSPARHKSTIAYELNSKNF